MSIFRAFRGEIVRMTQTQGCKGSHLARGLQIDISMKLAFVDKVGEERKEVD